MHSSTLKLLLFLESKKLVSKDDVGEQEPWCGTGY